MSVTRYLKSKSREVGLLAGIALVGLLLPLKAGAVNLSIDSMFVHRNNGNCLAVRDSNSGVVQFRCPPIPTSITCSGSPASCSAGHGNNIPSTGPCEGGIGARTVPVSPYAGVGNFGNI